MPGSSLFAVARSSRQSGSMAVMAPVATMSGFQSAIVLAICSCEWNRLIAS